MSTSPSTNPGNRHVGGETSAKPQVARAAAVSLAGDFANHGLRLVSNVMLSRLLFPEAFGLMAIIRTVINGLGMMSDVGLRPAVIQHLRGGEPDFLRTAWSIQALRGAGLWLIGCSIAYPAAAFYENRDLLTLLPAACAITLITGLRSSNFLLQARELILGRIVLIELSSQVLALIAMVAFALVHPSVWALVVGTIVAAILNVVLSHVALPGPPSRFGWDKDAARDILSFGKWVFFSTLITFLAMRFDVIMLGKFLSMESLGVYSIGIMIAGMPRQVLDKLTQSILLPVFSAAQREGQDEFSESFREARRLVLPAVVVVLLGCIAVSPAFIECLYDDRYQDAAWIAQLSILPLWFNNLHNTSGHALLAIGDSRSFALSNVARLSITVVACLVGLYVGDIVGLIFGLSLGAICGYAVVAISLRAHGLRSARVDIFYSAVGIALGFFCGYGPHLLVPFIEFQNIGLLTIAISAPILAPFGLVAARRLHRARSN